MVKETMCDKHYMYQRRRSNTEQNDFGESEQHNFYNNNKPSVFPYSGVRGGEMYAVHTTTSEEVERLFPADPGPSNMTFLWLNHS